MKVHEKLKLIRLLLVGSKTVVETTGSHSTFVLNWKNRTGRHRERLPRGVTAVGRLIVKERYQ